MAYTFVSWMFWLYVFSSLVQTYCLWTGSYKVPKPVSEGTQVFVVMLTLIITCIAGYIKYNP